MVSKKLTVVNKSGIHARPAGVLVKAVEGCTSEVTILTNGRTIQAKSILKIMSAGLKKGTEFELCCNGENEEADLEKLAALIESGLGEEVE